MKTLLFTLALTLSLCAFPIQTNIKSGHWETHLQLKKNYILPVHIFIKDNVVTIKNGKESIVLKSIKKKDNNLIIAFPFFNSEIIITSLSNKKMLGYWANYAKGPDYRINFVSRRKKNKTKKNKSLEKLNGRWQVQFDFDKNSDEISVGELEVVDNKLYGTFLTETGDFRFLEGNVIQDSLYLSCFDGSHAFLFTATLKNDTLKGTFLSGTHYQTSWMAFKNDSVKLRDPETLTYAINDNKINLTLTDTDNNEFTYPNGKTEKKITFIQIFGTWCPNCIDETIYLDKIYSKYGDKINIIAIGFERGDSKEQKLAQLLKYKNYFNIEYDVLLGGPAAKKAALEIFPMLNTIMAFPTLIVLNEQQEIIKIHTGFNGPGTGQHYDDFKKEMEEFIQNSIHYNLGSSD